MFVRVLVIIAIFDRTLAWTLAPPLLALALLALVLGGSWYWVSVAQAARQTPASPPANPLELTAALVFAASFVAVSLISTWASAEFGEAGVYGLAAIVGFTDINPFVLSIAAGGAGQLPADAAAAAILIAASSNNLLQAIYATVFAGARAAAGPAAALALLALAGAGAAWWIAAAGGVL
jgi:uncharacterized membrane protein (DUF4010 family)